MSIPNSPDRPPNSETDNPRHIVWIDDDQGLRRITAKNPGDEKISVDGTIYHHTRERDKGQWIYTRAQ